MDVLDTGPDLGLMLLLWALVAATIFFVRWRREAGGVGIVFTYLLLLAQAHWLSALGYLLLPRYSLVYDPRLTQLGFEQSLYGVVAFAAGSIILAPIFSRMLIKTQEKSLQHPAVNPPDRRLPEIYLTLGVVTHFALVPLTINVPSVSAITTGFSQLLLAGQVLGCWRAWKSGNLRSLIRWLMLAAIWPVLTMAEQGFLGFGAVMALVVFVFFIQIAGFHKWYIPVGVVVVYLGLSILVTYSAARSDIRQVVWSDESSLDRRLGIVYSSLSNFQWFDPYDARQFDFIDRRQAQNFYVGRAIQRLSTGRMDYSAGATIWDSALSLVPRAIWPDKPIRTGGSQQLTLYTGIQIYGGTSVGIGQVLEFYVNFGTIGVVGGFLILGTLMTLLDEAAAQNLKRGDWQRFALLYVPALGLLQPENPLISVTVLSVSGFIAIILANRFVLPLLQRKPESAYPVFDFPTPNELESTPVLNGGNPEAEPGLH